MSVTVQAVPFLGALVVLVVAVNVFCMTALSTGRRWPGFLVVAALTAGALRLGYAAIT